MHLLNPNELTAVVEFMVVETVETSKSPQLRMKRSAFIKKGFYEEINYIFDDFCSFMRVFVRG